jgi:hypothetical protein
VHVLEALGQVAVDYGTELSALQLPLRRCGKVCKEFEDMIESCTKHTDGQRRSLRDWTKLQYMGDDITKFGHVLANYKGTINIALGGATL